MEKKLRASSVKVLEFLSIELTFDKYHEWGFIVELLEKEFNWSPKTCSNRIHELVESGQLERIGTFEKPTPRRRGGHDLRKIKIVSKATPKTN
jgi:hypothetical protein